MTNEYGLLHAYLLDGHGGAAVLSIEQVNNWQPSQGMLWLHFDYSHPDAETWLLEQSGVDHVIANALVMDETRPRATTIDDGLLIALRGINHNPGSEDDMIALRMWIDKQRIITSRRRKLHAASTVVNELQHGSGPADSGEFLCRICDHIIGDMSETVGNYEDKVADYEDALLDGVSGSLRYDLATLRRQTITIRRYLAPQREALAKLLTEKVSWLNDNHKIELREINDQLIRHIENLDAARERAAVTQEELLNRLSEQMNKRMYVLSVVAAIFLPLSFLTGLLGVNVAGIPGSDNEMAFWLFNLLLGIVVVMQIMIFRWQRWF
ncbi:zinc transporter ZntB [Methylophaga sp. OBS4]|uniref:zinc transporter ZntB n=1 Tax=Methylophaga sp. OBS4 TaxID=2991935 RepID=UPI002256436C|nr:zinc transporter ZntB [Methylophaga sp. OBS4]MCX4188491.1 zinc transporter ZntB [Methylophaga sp. OBS4]